MDGETKVGFDATRWTLVDALGADDESVRDAALQQLAVQYWPPVYAHLRCKGFSKDEAAELTQGFFADVVLSRKLLQRAEKRQFRLRSLLLRALQNYMIDQHRRQKADRARAAVPLERLDQEENILAKWGGGSDGQPGLRQDSPEKDFDRRWAMVILHEAVGRCEEHLKQFGQSRHWSLFEARVLNPMHSGNQPQALRQLADELGFRSYADATEAMRNVRKKLKTIFLPQVLAETNSKPEDRDEEYQLLMSLLAG